MSVAALMSYELLIIMFLLPLLYLAKKMHGTWVSPVTMFTGIWFLQSVLLFAGPVVYDGISLKTALIVVAAHMAFFAAYIIVWIPVSSTIQLRKAGALARYPSDVALFWMIGASSLLGLVGLAIIIHYLVSTGEIVIMLTQPYTFRDMCLKELIDFPFMSHVFTTFPIAGVGLAGIHLATARRRRWVAVMPMTVIIAISMVDAGKALIVWTMSLFLGSYAYTKYVILGERLHWGEIKRIVLVGFAFVVILMSLSAYRLKAADDIIEYQQDLYDMPYRYGKGVKLLFPFIDIMNYVSISLPSLSIYLDEPDFTSGSGEYTFRPIARYIFDHDVDFHFEHVLTPIPSNIYTALHELMIDFGVGGAIAFIGLLGALCALLYSRISRAFNYVSLVFLCFVSTFMLYSVFLAISYSTKFWISLFMMLAAYPLVVRRSHARSPH